MSASVKCLVSNQHQAREAVPGAPNFGPAKQNRMPAPTIAAVKSFSSATSDSAALLKFGLMFNHKNLLLGALTDEAATQVSGKLGFLVH